MITKLRASKILVETPKEGSETWVHITVQKVTKKDDGVVINIIPRYDYISFPIQDIGTNIYNAIDPTTSANLNISGYGAVSTISSIVIDKLIKKYGGSVTPQGDVIV